jgi:hypothetical protein
MLAEASLRTLVGLSSPAPVTAALVCGGLEVFSVPRVTLTDWAAEGPAVAAIVVFGPYNQPVSFDAIRLYHGGEQLIDLPRLSVLNLDPGEVFSEPIELSGAVAG